MSTADNNGDPLVEALRRKTNYQADRIDELEEQIVGFENQIEDLEWTIQELRRELAEVKE